MLIRPLLLLFSATLSFLLAFPGQRYPVTSTATPAEEPPKPVFPYNAAQEFPVINAGRVVWQDARAGATDIYLWSAVAAAPRNLTNSSGWEVQPALDGDLVVWKDGDQGIGIHGLNLQSGARFTVTVGQADTSRPRLSGQTVVWAANGGNGDWNIDGYDIGRAQGFVIDNQPGNQADPQIDWPWVVWWDEHEHIHLHNLQSGVTRTLLATQATKPNQRSMVQRSSGKIAALIN
jgi:beta propeller repeat protein